MATQTWIPGTVGDWATGSNWDTGIPPATGDLLIISSGFAVIAEGSTISGVDIVLGGEPTASAVILAAIDSTFAPADSDDNDMQIRVSGGHPVTSPLHARFMVEGDTSFEGQIIVQAMGGSLTIESLSDGETAGNFTLQKSTILVTQESFLSLEGDTFTNGGLIQVDGGMHIAAGATLTGFGSVVLEAGGHLSVEGAVEGHQVNFADGTGSVTLTNADFDGVFGFTTIGGAEIDLAGVVGQSDGFLVTPDGVYLAVYSGLDQTGPIVATLAVQMIDAGSLFPVSNTLTPDDFDLSSDGKGGTLITYAPAGPIVLQQALPVPIVAAPAQSGQPPQTVSLSTILLQSFGTTTPNFTEIVLLPTKVAEDTTGNDVFWGPSSMPPQWLVGGQKVTENMTVTASDDVQLVVGDQINWPAQFQVRTTPIAWGPAAEFVVYDVWTVNPDVVGEVEAAGFTGLPTPAAVVASAQAFASIYGHVPNNDLCNWIADNVAAGAGASLPPANFALDPTENQPGGFWRIVYSGAQPTPVTDWSSKVQPGDIVRMGWLNPEDSSIEAVSGHTTTVLGAVTSEGLISVYDNIDYATKGVESIGIHDANYWVSTNPADITIYRLDPRQQYLIEGTSVAEQIQGSVFNDLIRPAGGADLIAVGPGNNVVQGTTHELAGISVIDFGPGDLLNFTDLAAAGAAVLFSDGALNVYDNHALVATVVLPPPEQSAFFFVRSDGSGGTHIGLLDPATQIEMLYIGYLGRAGDPAGAQYWQSELTHDDSTTRLKSIASSFAVQPETSSAYPFLADPQQATPAEITAFITAQYQELFGRAPDAPGLAYWQSYLTDSIASPQAVGVFPLLLMFGAMNTDLALDLTTLDNKATVAEYVVAQFGAADLDFGSGPSAANDFAHQIIDQVNSTQDSVAAAEAAVLAFIEDQMELVGVAP